MTADEVFREVNATFFAACEVAGELSDLGLPSEKRAELLARHQALRAQHASLGALYSKLITPNLAVH